MSSVVLSTEQYNTLLSFVTQSKDALNKIQSLLDLASIPTLNTNINKKETIHVDTLVQQNNKTCTRPH